jgi:hypothetical protein
LVFSRLRNVEAREQAQLKEGRRLALPSVPPKFLDPGADRRGEGAVFSALTRSGRHLRL